MQHLLLFEDFINEELIYGKKLNQQDSNLFASLFNSDALKLREFIQSKLNLQNLKFIGGGAIGLAFLWKDRIIKFTTDLSEKQGVEKMIRLTPGEKVIPGFAKYYWIKEVTLPQETWKKPTHDLSQEEIDKIKQQRRDKSNNSPKSEQFDSRKKLDKIKKAYIICLEKLKMVDEHEETISILICNLMNSKRWYHATNKYLKIGEDNSEKLKSIYKWIQSDQIEYKEPEFVDLGLDKEQIWSNEFLGLNKSVFKDFEKNWSKITLNEFIEFSKKILNIYYIGDKLGIPTSDIKSDNIGYRGDELVAFDCM